MRRSERIGSWMLALVAVACGCSGRSGPARVAGEGTVRRGGALVDEGLVSFQPAAGHSGPAATTVIVAGHYRFDASNGPVPGPHRVVVRVIESNKMARMKGDASADSKAAPKDGKTAPSTREFAFDVPELGPFRKDFAFE
ncbi:MAG: hypothetical protein ACYC35_16925 [Pirellulales bacterium]